MTQSAPSDRAKTALRASGMSGSPLMSLERDDALFVLTDDTLVYQDGGGTRRVTLRDLTRIHSDQAGLLRVETPAGTALTASLLGFDVTEVQNFFKGVRSATARAKDVPGPSTPTSTVASTSASIPALGGTKTFGSAPAGTGPSQTATPETNTSAAGSAGATAKPASSGAPTPGLGAGHAERPAGQMAASTEPGKPDLAKTEPGKTEPGKTDTASPASTRSEPSSPLADASSPAVQADKQAQAEKQAEKADGAATPSRPPSSPSFGTAPTSDTAPTSGAALGQSPAVQSPAVQTRPGESAAQKTPAPSLSAASSLSAAAGPLAGVTLTPQPPEVQRPQVTPKPPEPAKRIGDAENPVVISSSSFSPNISKPGLGAVAAPAKTEPSRTPKPEAGKAPEPAKAPEQARLAAPKADSPSLSLPKTKAADPADTKIELPNRPAPRSPVPVLGAAPVGSQDAGPVPEAAAALANTSADPVPVKPASTALSKVAGAAALARQAETVDALAGRLKLLGAVLFVAAVALAFFQFTGGQALAGIWTLLSGGVGAIALVALSELSALLSLLARAKND